MKDIANITPRQKQILDAVIEHLCDKAAAASLGLSANTIAAHAHRAMVAVGARNRLDLLLRWDRYRRAQA